MKNLTQIKPLIKDSASFFRSQEGKKQLLETLEKVSGKIEITPPITLDKLMSVFGTTALMFPPNVPTDKTLEVGRISTQIERESWVIALGNLDKLLNNRGLEQIVLGQSDKINLDELNSLETFAEELAIRTRVLLMEINNTGFTLNSSQPLPNQLKIGELLASQLDTLVEILEIENSLSASENLPDTNQENQRTSRIATEALLKKDFLPVSSSASYQAMREVVALKKFSKDVESPFPTAFVEKSSIKGKIQLTPLQTEAVYGEKLKELEMSMWQKREQLSDLHVDVIDAMCATWIVQASSDESRAVITADDVLKLRGLKPHLSGTGRRGGYTMEQREEIVNAVQDLENIWFEITEKVKRGKKSKSDFIQSRAVVVTDRGGQMRLDGSLDVMWFVFRPGSIFARYLLTEGRQSALLAAQALRYNVRTEAVEKRLVRYLSWQWRIRSKSVTYLQPYEAQTLIKEAGIKVPNRNANRACERLEKALDKLQTDSLIRGWQYVDWNWENAKKHGWIKNWLTTKIAIEPPDLIRDSYESIGQTIEKPLLSLMEKTPPPRNETEIALQTKARRKALNLSQMQLAENLRLSQPTLSRIESARKVSKEETQKILEWLAATTENTE
ncbi:MAG: helix-turn-helix transcriptional regulator [Pyrinomonadaceae bacterium]|nr:helix-turn-helix transcriptional regulator [Pyrinomonadaceae bacterium]